MPDSERSESGRIAADVRYLTGAGAHWVLAAPSKAPYWRGWQRRCPGADDAVDHLLRRDEPLGLMPASIHATGVDVDAGDPTLLLAQHPCWFDLEARRGIHAYYRDEVARDNASWEAYGCKGDIRSGRGFLLIHRVEGIGKLAAAVRNGPAGVLFPFGQLGLWESQGIILPRQAGPTTFRTLRAASRAATLDPPEVIGVGQRNVSLFNHSRFHAYGAWPSWDGDKASWHSFILQYAIGINSRFADPLPGREVERTAYSISTWVASGGGPQHHDCTSEAQRRRGVVSGLVRRGIIPSKQEGDKGSRRTGKLRTDIWARDRRIVALRCAGATQAAIAEEVGCSRRLVGYVLRRDGGRILNSDKGPDSESLAGAGGQWQRTLS